VLNKVLVIYIDVYKYNTPYHNLYHSSKNVSTYIYIYRSRGRLSMLYTGAFYGFGLGGSNLLLNCIKQND